MGLVTKTVKVKWTNYIKKHYESLGYIYTKNNNEFEVKVEDLPKNSKTKVECSCDCCGKPLIWIYRDYNKCVKEDGKTYCRGCAIKLYGKTKEIKTKSKNRKSLYDWCIENGRGDILKRWDYKKNSCSPKDVLYKTNKKMWFKCGKHPEHKSELKTISNFTRGQEGSIECNQCNSIAQYIIDNYRKEFLWIIWSDKNKISPFEISIHSNKKVWWNCPGSEHKSFERSCQNSVIYEFRCPECVKEKKESIIEEKTRLYLEKLGYKVKTEYSCTIIPKNPKTGHLLPFDNEIILGNGKHLIIEVHGEQHYRSSYFMVRKKITKEEAGKELYYQQVKDRYKRIKCIQAGYEYLEIPYTTFDKKETYKKLIDNKIKEILNLNKKSLKNNKQE